MLIVEDMYQNIGLKKILIDIKVRTDRLKKK